MAWVASHFREEQRLGSELTFWVQPHNEPPYLIDLSEFSIGRRISEGSDKRGRWGGDFDGLPKLAQEFANFVHLERPNKATSRRLSVGLRHFLRAITSLGIADIESTIDLRDGHGWLLKQHFGEAYKGRRKYRDIKTLIDCLREITGQRKLFWPKPDAEVLVPEEDVDTQGIQRLYNHLKAEARSIKQMFKDGERLSKEGRDPRIIMQPSSRRYPTAGWGDEANHAWLIYKLSTPRLKNKEEILTAGGKNLSNNYNQRKQIGGPTYLSPGMKMRGSAGIVGKYRWFHPSFHDTAVFFWLFLLGTGWNFATALALDVSDDGSWAEDHPHKGDFKILHSFKRRAGKHVFALSLQRPEWHPYQIVRYMIERTQYIRNTLRYQLAEAETRLQENDDFRMRIEVERLKEALKSPWLYHNLADVGSVGAFSVQHAGSLNSSIRDLILSSKLQKLHPSLKSLGTSMARDAWISRAYVATSHTVFLAQLAAQHSDLRSLKHYIQRRRFRNRSEIVTRTIQAAAFDEIVGRRVLDPVRLRILAESGIVTPEQEHRLLDYRQRTRLGMGCLNPRDPPIEIAPNHHGSQICRVQRCTGCRHGVIFSDSIGPLTRSRAELIHLRRSISASAWEGSSFSEELLSIEASLESFEKTDVERLTDEWLQKYRSGGDGSDVTYPAY